MSAGAFLLASRLWQNGKAGLGCRWTSGWTRCPECRRHAVDMQPVPSLCEAGRRVSKDIKGGDIGPQNSWKSLLRCTMLMFPSLGFCHHLAPTFIVRLSEVWSSESKWKNLVTQKTCDWGPSCSTMGTCSWKFVEHWHLPTSPQEVDVTFSVLRISHAEFLCIYVHIYIHMFRNLIMVFIYTYVYIYTQFIIQNYVCIISLLKRVNPSCKLQKSNNDGSCQLKDPLSCFEFLAGIGEESHLAWGPTFGTFSFRSISWKG